MKERRRKEFGEWCKGNTSYGKEKEGRNSGEEGKGVKKKEMILMFMAMRNFGMASAASETVQHREE